MDITELQKLIATGCSQREIAKITGKSQTTVRYWLDKHELYTDKVHKCKCGEDDLKKFHPGRYSVCRRCRKQWQKNRFRNFKAKTVAYKGGCCIKCGYCKCQAALDFHHVDPKQKDPNWRKMIKNWSFEKVKKELDKCELVCRNCHAEIHHFGDGSDGKALASEARNSGFDSRIPD